MQIKSTSSNRNRNLQNLSKDKKKNRNKSKKDELNSSRKKKEDFIQTLGITKDNINELGKELKLKRSRVEQNLERLQRQKRNDAITDGNEYDDSMVNNQISEMRSSFERLQRLYEENMFRLGYNQRLRNQVEEELRQIKISLNTIRDEEEPNAYNQGLKSIEKDVSDIVSSKIKLNKFSLKGNWWKHIDSSVSNMTIFTAVGKNILHQIKTKPESIILTADVGETNDYPSEQTYTYTLDRSELYYYIKEKDRGEKVTLAFSYNPTNRDIRVFHIGPGGQ